MKATLVLAVVCVLVSSVLCDHWALLVAGSNTWDNYRHQADVCHAYQILHKHGIPDERIVVMMYDDIAHNPSNPYPGNIINKPNGTNVYPGVPKDYTKDEVTPQVFLKVLTGDDKGVEELLGRKGKVIKSGPNDHVFVNFADHGAPGLIAFPTHVLSANDLNNAILKMHKNRQYKEMVFYIEACESGSMFDGILKSDINVYATTAADGEESSYACYWNEKRQTYLGDLYSVNWMEDSDVENLNTETLFKQFEIVKKKTNLSHVQEYGDLSINKQKVGVFQGGKSALKFRKHNEHFVHPTIDAVPSENVPMEILRRRIISAKGPEKHRLQETLESLLKKNEEVRKFFQHIVDMASDSADYSELLTTKVHFSDFTCYTDSVDIILAECPGMNLPQNDQALRNLRALANLCEMEVSMEKVWSIIRYVIRKSPLCDLPITAL